MPSVHEYLGLPESWPIREKIKHEIVLMPNARDIRRAKKADPRACALHNAACRMFDIPNCAIGGRWAYIPQRDERGKYYIARMQAPAETQKAIKRFDKTGKMPEGGFRFVPVPPSQGLKKVRIYKKKWHAGEVGHNSSPKGHKRRRIAPTRGIPTGVRAGA